MSLNRRDFVKLCTGTVAGFGVAQMFHPAVREALAGTLTGERPLSSGCRDRAVPAVQCRC